MWLSRVTSELHAVPPMAYWISALAATAIISAVLASSFQQSLSEMRLNSTLSREFSLRENYESEIRDLKFQLGEMRRRLDEGASGLKAPARKQQVQLLRQFQEIEALVTLAEQSNLVLSSSPPSPKRKPLQREAYTSHSNQLSFASQKSGAPLDILKTLSGGEQSNILQPPAPHKDFYAKQAQSELLLTAYTQAALDDIKRANTLIRKAGVTPPALVTQSSSAGGIYQDIGSADFDSSMITARWVIEQRIELSTKVNALPFARPLSSFNISSPYGARTDPFLGKPAIHTGLDFKAPRGTAVKATGTGIVSLSRYNRGYGLSVEIMHDDGLVTRYAHMHRLLVSEGQRISIGDIIGTVGNTGRSTGPHLHYEVRLNGKPVNPMRFIRTGDRLAAIFNPEKPTKIALNLP